MKKLLVCLLLSNTVSAQVLPDSITAKIDSVFKYYTNASPGAAIAVVKNGTVHFQKGYGMANLEYAVPVTPSTIFHIASESKQYVAFCMLLLEKEGKLSLDEDIRTYLDYLPDFGHKITIRHLIYHTSGLRDQWQLLANAGWQLDDVIKQEHVVRLVSKQNALNFTPGSEWMYCNTGYTLMAEIVKKQSGLTLREYTQKNIFGPLGMKDTHFHDNYTELVPGRAYSYNSATGGKYEHAVLSYSTVGATSLFTTVLDEAKWLTNYNTGTVGGKELIKKMHEIGMLNDGRKLNYAYGLTIGTFKGWQQVSHGGADAGYRTFATRFPDKDLAIVVFSNYGSANPGRLANLVAELLITESRPETPATENYSADTSLFKKMVGKFYSERGEQAEISYQKGKVFVRTNPTAVPVEFKLTEDGANRYKLSTGGVMVLDPAQLKQDALQNLQVVHQNFTQYFMRQPASPKTITAEYAGKYFSEETEAFYTIVFKDGKLSLEHRKFGTVPLTYLAPDQFNSPHWWMSHIRFIRDKKQKIVAYEVNAGRVQRLRYSKVKS